MDNDVLVDNRLFSHILQQVAALAVILQRYMPSSYCVDYTRAGP